MILSHRNTQALVLVFSLLLCVLGAFFIQDGGLALWGSGDGVPVYPISSGSHDGTILKAGLLGFIFSVLVSTVALIFKLKARVSLGGYLICSVCFAITLLLVSLDTSVWSAFVYGDVWPFISACVWLCSCVILLGVVLSQWWMRSPKNKQINKLNTKTERK